MDWGQRIFKKAVKNIFKLKKRPSFNPLIVHYFSFKEANKDVVLNKIFLNFIKFVRTYNFCIEKKQI